MLIKYVIELCFGKSWKRNRTLRKSPNKDMEVNNTRELMEP